MQQRLWSDPSRHGSSHTFSIYGLHATLLGCIITDVAVSPTSLQTALDYAVDRSFDSISVDGDMSTNDTVVVLANRAAHPEEKEIDQETDWEGHEIFRNEMTSFARGLAQLVVWDGEGAAKFVIVNVEVHQQIDRFAVGRCGCCGDPQRVSPTDIPPSSTARSQQPSTCSQHHRASVENHFAVMLWTVFEYMVVGIQFKNNFIARKTQ